MKGEQTNMLNQHSAQRTAEIVPFPVDRETVYVKETAKILASRQGASAERFWQMTRNRLYARLVVQGVSGPLASAEVRRFADAVQVQMNATEALSPGNNPRGAA